MRRSSSLSIALLVTVVASIAWGAQALRPQPVQAIPMFAKRTGASCQLCHTVFPGMTNYGMMVMMSDFAPLPYHAAADPGFASVVLSEQYASNPDGNPAPPKLFTDNVGILSGGYFGPHVTYYLEQHIVDGGFVGGTDQLWLSYNELFKGTGDLQVGKFHTPFPFMPAHRITIARYAATSTTIGSNAFNEDDSHWGVTLSQMPSAVMFSLSALGGNQLICQSGCAQLGGNNTNHSLDFSAMTMNAVGLNAGAGVIYNGFSPPAMPGGSWDRFNRTALYLEYIPPGYQQLQFQALGQIGSDSDPFGTGQPFHMRGFFTEAQYDFKRGNWGILRWDYQNGDTPTAGLTLDLIHQFAPNLKLTLEGRTLTTGTTMGVSVEYAGPWTRRNVLAQPVLGSMPGMAGMNMMPGMTMAMAEVSPTESMLAQGDAVAGHALFDSYSCAACHGVGGSGGGIGPKLVGISDSVTPIMMYDFVKHPRAPMPNFKLSDTDIANLIAYVVTLTPGHTVAGDIAKAHGGTTAMGGMNMGGMHGMNMGGMSMAQPPPVYPEDQKPFEGGTQGYFPGLERGDPSAGSKTFSQRCEQCHNASAQGALAVQWGTLTSMLTPSALAWRLQSHPAVSPAVQLTNKEISDLTAYLESMTTAKNVFTPIERSHR
jgi:mono/diheme cytochrome c family protein